MHVPPVNVAETDEQYEVTAESLALFSTVRSADYADFAEGVG
jgi:hypothetical protein